MSCPHGLLLPSASSHSLAWGATLLNQLFKQKVKVPVMLKRTPKGEGKAEQQRVGASWGLLWKALTL
jgi:hypothetical protein